MPKTRTQLCQELADALKVWNQMNDDIEAMRGTVTQGQHAMQQMIVDSLVRELEALQ